MTYRSRVGAFTNLGLTPFPEKASVDYVRDQEIDPCHHTEITFFGEFFKLRKIICRIPKSERSYPAAAGAAGAQNHCLQERKVEPLCLEK